MIPITHFTPVSYEVMPFLFNMPSEESLQLPLLLAEVGEDCYCHLCVVAQSNCPWGCRWAQCGALGHRCCSTAVSTSPFCCPGAVVQ